MKVYISFGSYGGGRNNLHIAQTENGLFATSLKSDKQAVKNLKRMLKRRVKK